MNDTNPSIPDDGAVEIESASVTSVSLPLQLCRPRCFVLSPLVTRDNAIEEAGAYRSKIFGNFAHLTKQWLTRGRIASTLVEYRLLPFWHVYCTSYFHYSRENAYKLEPLDGDAYEITIRGPADSVLSYGVDKKSGIPHATVFGVETCITERERAEYFRSYEIQVPADQDGRLLDDAEQLQKRLEALTQKAEARQADFGTLLQLRQIKGEPVATGMPEDQVQLLLPNKTPNIVASAVLKKVMASIEPIAMLESVLSVQLCDLYYHPVYVFKFELLNKEDRPTNEAYAQLDAITKTWLPLAGRQFKQPSVSADKVLLLTLEAGAVVLRELGGPWLRIAAGLIEVGAKHAPGIMDDLRSAED